MMVADENTTTSFWPVIASVHQFQIETACPTLAVRSVCISVPLWQIRIFGLFFHAKSGYPDFIRIFCAGPYRPLGLPVYTV